MWFLGVQDFGLESCEAWDFRCQRFCSRFSNYAAWFRAVFDNDAQRLEASSRSDTNGKWQQHSLQTPRRKLATWRTQLGDANAQSTTVLIAPRLLQSSSQALCRRPATQLR